MAWNLQGFGQHPLFVSAVGKDETGLQVCEQMSAWSMDVSGIQLLPNHPTGKVSVTLDAGQPSYEILPNQAYDFIDFASLDPALTRSTQDTSLVYHGTLAFRSEKTRHAIAELRKRLNAPVFVDLNIRQPWFQLEWLDDILDGISWLKLNVAELANLTGHELPEDSDQSLIERAVIELSQRFPAEIYFVTAGGHGAYAISASGEVKYCPTPKLETIVDTVGAGDAFAAVAIYGLLHDWNCSEILRRAVKFAAKVCQINGATVNHRAFYEIDSTETGQHEISTKASRSK